MALGIHGLEVIERQSMADMAIDRLIMAIATRKLAPGSRIIEGEIAESLGISRVPVREAVQQLATQGVLSGAGVRGLRVASFDAAHLREVYGLRVALEGVMLRQAMPRLRASPALVHVLDLEIDRMAEAAGARDPIAINSADLAFHRCALAASGHELGMKTWVGISRHVQIIFGMEVVRRPDFQEIHAQHVSLRDTLLKGDPDALDAEIAEHITGRRSLIGETGYSEDNQ